MRGRVAGRAEDEVESRKRRSFRRLALRDVPSRSRLGDSREAEAEADQVRRDAAAVSASRKGFSIRERRGEGAEGEAEAHTESK